MGDAGQVAKDLDSKTERFSRRFREDRALTKILLNQTRLLIADG